ncbi:MAG TPA: ABC-2 family transporter protein [Thermomicrobiales bacterium]|nr:ABC-2 family transporter protein [Thermomicrobiales bacterium]
MNLSLPTPRSVRRNLRLYFILQFVQLRAAVEYRADFWIGILGAMLQQAAGLVFISALFSQIPEVSGWTVWDIAILYGLAMIPKGLTEFFCDGPWMLRSKVNTGEFDRVLVRPISPALQSATAIVSIHGFGQILLGVVVLWLGMSRSEMQLAWWTFPFLLITLLASSIMIGAINFIINMIGFWEPSAQSALPTMVALMIDFAKFPLDIYNMVIKGLVTIVVPYAFISYFPALLLLGKATPWRWLGLATPLATAVVVAFAAWLWSKALNRYQGVGH